MKRGGLGRGLSALLPGAVEEGFGLLEIPVEAVAPKSGPGEIARYLQRVEAETYALR